MAGDDLGDIAPWRVWERHRVRAEHRRQFLEEAKVHQAAVQPIIDSADFPSWRDFYIRDERRSEDDVAVGELDDGEFHWKICWYSGTQEVVAYPATWVDERWHSVMFQAGGYGDRGGGHWSLGISKLPESIYLLGHACSADGAREQLASARDLNHARILLLNPT